jgi:hypothetical protein
MRNLTFKAACRNLYDISRRGKLALLVHARPDGDCIGSAYATAVLLEAVGCNARVVCADPLPARLRFIAESAGLDSEITIDKIPEDFTPGNVTAVALDIAAATQLGAISAGKPLGSPEANDAKRYADGIGTAFQIIDDLLDRTGSTEELGKTVGKDKNCNKLTYVSLYGLDEAKKKFELLINDCYGIVNKYNSEIFINILNKLRERILGV